VYLFIVVINIVILIDFLRSTCSNGRLVNILQMLGCIIVFMILGVFVLLLKCSV